MESAIAFGCHVRQIGARGCLWMGRDDLLVGSLGGKLVQRGRWLGRGRRWPPRARGGHHPNGELVQPGRWVGHLRVGTRWSTGGAFDSPPGAFVPKRLPVGTARGAPSLPVTAVTVDPKCPRACKRAPGGPEKGQFSRARVDPATPIAGSVTPATSGDLRDSRRSGLLTAQWRQYNNGKV